MEEVVYAEECLECRVILIIYFEDMEPSKISECLGVESTSAAVKGTIVGPNSLGRTRAIPISRWELSSELEVKSQIFEEHLDWILSRIDPVKFRTLMSTFESLNPRLSCIWWTKKGGGFRVRKDQLEKLALIGIDLDFGIAAFDE